MLSGFHARYWKRTVQNARKERPRPNRQTNRQGRAKARSRIRGQCRLMPMPHRKTQAQNWGAAVRRDKGRPGALPPAPLTWAIMGFGSYRTAHYMCRRTRAGLADESFAGADANRSGSSRSAHGQARGRSLSNRRRPAAIPWRRCGAGHVARYWVPAALTSTIRQKSTVTSHNSRRELRDAHFTTCHCSKVKAGVASP